MIHPSAVILNTSGGVEGGGWRGGVGGGVEGVERAMDGRSFHIKSAL